MVTAISDMENPLEENDHAILTNAEEDEDIPFTVDEGNYTFSFIPSIVFHKENPLL